MEPQFLSFRFEPSTNGTKATSYWEIVTPKRLLSHPANSKSKSRRFAKGPALLASFASPWRPLRLKAFCRPTHATLEAFYKILAGHLPHLTRELQLKQRREDF